MADLVTFIGIPLVCLICGYILGATNGRAEKMAKESADVTLSFANWLCQQNGVDFMSMLKEYADSNKNVKD